MPLDIEKAVLEGSGFFLQALTEKQRRNAARGYTKRLLLKFSSLMGGGDGGEGQQGHRKSVRMLQKRHKLKVTPCICSLPKSPETSLEDVAGLTASLTSRCRSIHLKE